MAKKPYFQAAGQKHLDRKDHVWACYKAPQGDGVLYKCVLCGAVTCQSPPSYPTPVEWMPRAYVELTQGERALCPPEYCA